MQINYGIYPYLHLHTHKNWPAINFIAIFIIQYFGYILINLSKIGKRKIIEIFLLWLNLARLNCYQSKMITVTDETITLNHSVVYERKIV